MSLACPFHRPSRAAGALVVAACALASSAAVAQPAASLPAAPQAPAPPSSSAPAIAPAAAQWPYEPIPGMPLGPREIPYDEDDPIRAGYHLEPRRRKGMIVGGVVAFAAFYLNAIWWERIASGFSISGDNRPLLIPLAGPFITMGTAKGYNAFGVAMLATLGVGQLGGVALLTAGIITKGNVQVRDDVTRVAPRSSVVPFVGMGTVGVAGRF